MTLAIEARRIFSLLPAAVLLLALFLAGPAEAAVTRVESAGQGGFRGVLELAADPLYTMRPTPFTLTLFDPAGRQTASLEPHCDLVMPAMPMPENRPRLTTGQNRFSGEAIFTMAGDWQMLVSFATASGAKEQLTFDLGRVLLK